MLKINVTNFECRSKQNKWIPKKWNIYIYIVNNIITGRRGGLGMITQRIIKTGKVIQNYQKVDSDLFAQTLIVKSTEISRSWISNYTPFLRILVCKQDNVRLIIRNHCVMFWFFSSCDRTIRTLLKHTWPWSASFSRHVRLTSHQAKEKLKVFNR